MQPMIADLLAAPWAMLPDRLPFVRAALLDAHSGGQHAALQARTYAATNDAVCRRQIGNSDVAVLPFCGICVQRTDAMGELLGLVSIQRFAQVFRAALANDSVGGIVIEIDSPGGSVYGIAELADEIYRARGRKPMAAVVNSLAASGAYWIASSASEVYVTPGGEVGSIGVVAAHQNFSKSLDKAGVQMTLIVAGRYKTEGNSFQPLGADARRHMQSRIDEHYRQFVGAVAKHRNVTESAVRNGMGRGRLLDAERAKRENMVDAVATIDEVIDKLRKRVYANTAESSRSLESLGSKKPRPTAPCRLQTRQHVIDALSL